MQERRKLERKHLIFYLTVYRQQTGESLGDLLDLTTEGVQIRTETPVDEDCLMALEMDLPEEIEGSEQVRFEARCIRCDLDGEADFYRAGFSLHNLDPVNRTRIRRLIEIFAFQED